MPGGDHHQQPEAAPRTVIFFVAAEIECRALLRGLTASTLDPPRRWTVARCGNEVEVCLTGVGKANAAGAAGRVLDPLRHLAAISIGIAGSLPGGPPIGAVVVATGSAWADEGVRTPRGFVDIETMGFPIGTYARGVVPVDGTLSESLAERLLAVRGIVATVSTCSGVDSLANEFAARTGAIAEGMEGAAVGHAAHTLGIPFAEVRVISNTTGDREQQTWRIRESLEVLGRAAGAIAAALVGDAASRGIGAGRDHGL